MAVMPGWAECLLCHGRQPWAGPGHREHLARAHGVMQLQAQDFLLQVARQKARLAVPAQRSAASQTEERGDRCAMCGKDRAGQQEVMAWPCPLCPRLYTTLRYIELHLANTHANNDLVNLVEQKPVILPYKEFEEKKKASEQYKWFLKTPSTLQITNMTGSSSTGIISVDSKSKNDQKKSVKDQKKSKKVAHKASGRATFSCNLCAKEFAQDCNLNLHLSTAHPEQSVQQVERAKVDVTAMKLEGCLHRCAPCGNTFTVAKCFRQHIRDHHGLGVQRYRAEYGESEVVTGRFTCRLCERTVKHTRNAIVQHMTQVHQLTWKEYLARVQAGQTVSFPPKVDLFKCRLCGAAVSLAKPHLAKQHKIDEDVYAALYEEGTEASGALETCGLCGRDSLGLAGHLARCHGAMGREQYQREVAAGHSPPEAEGSELACPVSRCGQTFGRDHRLLLHVRTGHSELAAEAVSLAWREAEKAIASTKSSAAALPCGLCGARLASRKAFWGHVTKRHSMAWEDYLEQHGDPEVEAEWQCRLCGLELRHDQARVVHHLKTVHSLRWAEYREKVKGVEEVPAAHRLPRDNLEGFRRRRRMKDKDSGVVKMEPTDVIGLEETTHFERC